MQCDMKVGLHQRNNCEEQKSIRKHLLLLMIRTKQLSVVSCSLVARLNTIVEMNSEDHGSIVENRMRQPPLIYLLWNASSAEEPVDCRICGG